MIYITVSPKCMFMTYNGLNGKTSLIHLCTLSFLTIFHLDYHQSYKIYSFIIGFPLYYYDFWLILLSMHVTKTHNHVLLVSLIFL